MPGERAQTQGSPPHASAHGTPLLPLRLEGLCYAVGGQRLIDSIDVELKAGERTVVLGANGSGKSLLLRLCHGMLRPTSGRVVWNCGIERPGRQAMVFQRPVMLRRTVRANVEYALARQGKPRSERKSIAAGVLEQTGLAHLAGRSARVLSAGEQQRLALARVWALEPEVLFLDEPTSSLAPAGTAEVEELVLAISRSGTKIVMTTHDLGQARRMADEVLFLHGGRLLEQERSEHFFSKPRTAEARGYIQGELVP